jgi:hypothetical protein
MQIRRHVTYHFCTLSYLKKAAPAPKLILAQDAICMRENKISKRRFAHEKSNEYFVYMIGEKSPLWR